MKRKISGVILAGGDNKRFGGLTKSNIIVGGATILSRIAGTLEDIFEEIIIVTNKPSEFIDYTQFKITGDHFRKAGPLGGIHAGLRAASGDAAFIIAGDMPFPDRRLINEMKERFNASECDVLIPKIGNLIEPLHSIYSASLLPDLEKFITENENRSIRDFVRGAKTEYLRLEASQENIKAFTNINSRADLDKLTDDLYI